MAFTAASISPFSSLSISNSTRRLSLPPPKPTFSFSPKPSLKFAPIRASDDDKKDAGPFEYSNPEDDDEPFPFQEPPEDYEEPPMFDDGPMETEEEIAALFEEVYGPAYSGVSLLGNDILVMDSKFKKATKWGGTEVVKDRIKDGFDERVVQVRRVTKVVKGGKNMQFRAVVVVGDKQGHVGVGVGKAQEIAEAVAKSAVNARRNIINVPMTKYATFPHRADGYYGAATVMLRPALAGSGVTAGGVVRVILELAGIKNGLGKQLRSKNALNNARATLEAIKQMRQFSEVAEDRGIPMEQMWQ